MTEAQIIHIDPRRKRNIDEIIQVFSDPDRYNYDFNDLESEIFTHLVPEKIFEVLQKFGYFDMSEKLMFDEISQVIRRSLKRSNNLHEIFARLFVQEQRLDYVSNTRKFDKIQHYFYSDVASAAHDAALRVNHCKSAGALSLMQRAIQYQEVSLNPELSDRYGNKRVANDLAILASMYLERQICRLVEIFYDEPIEDKTEKDLFLLEFKKDVNKSLELIRKATFIADSVPSFGLKEKIFKRTKFYFAARNRLLRNFSHVFSREEAEKYDGVFAETATFTNKLGTYVMMHDKRK